MTEEGYVAYRDGKLLGTLAVRQQPQSGQQGRVRKGRGTDLVTDRRADKYDEDI